MDRIGRHNPIVHYFFHKEDEYLDVAIGTVRRALTSEAETERESRCKGHTFSVLARRDWGLLFHIVFDWLAWLGLRRPAGPAASGASGGRLQHLKHHHLASKLDMES